MKLIEQQNFCTALKSVFESKKKKKHKLKQKLFEPVHLIRWHDTVVFVCVIYGSCALFAVRVYLCVYVC